MDKKKKELIQYAIYFVLGLIIFGISLYTQGIGDAKNTLQVIRILSDSFLFPGMLFGGIGALTWISAKGNFDMLGYGFSYLINGMIHPKDKQETFYEYKMRKEEKGEAWLPQMFFVGLFYLALSVIFVIIFMSMES